MPEKKIAECIDGKMQFNIKNIDCDLMAWFRSFAQNNKRSVTQEIILAMEMVKDLNTAKIQ
jgi:hypothetical protein